MVTKKKKVVEDPANDIPVLATDAKAFAKKSKKAEVWPKVVKGSHLTVTTYQDGTTKLEWDDAALLKEVQEAITKYELDQLKPQAKTKSTKKKKSV